MNQTLPVNLFWLLFGVALASTFPSPCQSAVNEKKPNIILIVADDLGYGELGCYGQKWIRTPNIDQIAADGIRFTQFYAGSPVCAPSRCTLLTGKHTGHAYIRDNGNPPDRRDLGRAEDGYFPGQNPLADEETTIAELLKTQGYATAAIGKWGLGYENSSGDPNRQGFDLFYGYLCQVHAHNHFPRFLWRNGQREQLTGNTRTLNGQQHSQDKFTENALAFIRANQDKPFFLYLPLTIPHLSIQTTAESLAMYQGKIPEADYEHRGYLRHPYPRAGYAAMVSHVDRDVGKIVSLIKELGLDDNTIVMFTSDNGPTFNRIGGSDSDFFASSGPLHGRKASVYEGGIRVPLVARWPDHIQPGTETDHISAFWDMLPTLCGIAGAAAPAGIDGISFLPTLLGKPGQAEHESLYWEFPSYGGQQAMREGKWKAVRLRMFDTEGPIQLYDLSVDMGENHDVASGNREIVARMAAEMAASREPSALFPFARLDHAESP